VWKEQVTVRCICFVLLILSPGAWAALSSAQQAALDSYLGAKGNGGGRGGHFLTLKNAFENDMSAAEKLFQQERPIIDREHRLYLEASAELDLSIAATLRPIKDSPYNDKKGLRKIVEGVALLCCPQAKK
jgi:hypothetical protein